MRRRRSPGPLGALLSLLVKLPWPVLLAMGLAGAWWMHSSFFERLVQSPLAQGISWIQWAPLFAPLVVFGGLSLASFLRGRRRRNLLRKHSSLAAIRSMNWQDFERLVAEAYRRQGYKVTENGLGGADGGVDLILKRGQQTILVQCKRWRSQSIGVPIVREMWGLVHHHRATGAKVVTVGRFTAAAKTFARGKELELVDGQDLVELIASLEVPGHRPAPSIAPGRPPSGKRSTAPDCPRCGQAMVVRTARGGGEQFWGCPGFPGCRGTRPIQDSR